MKSVLIIGMSKLGRHLAEKTAELGNDVVIVDSDEKAVENMAGMFTDVVIGDCTSEALLSSLGVSNFDVCFVTVGENFQASIEITSILNDMGAEHIVAKASSERQAQVLKKVGANEVFFPEKMIANKLAVQYNANNIFDFVALSDEYAIFEIPVLDKWVGESLGNLDIRKRYHINIIAVKNKNILTPNLDLSYVFKAEDHIMVIGKNGDVFKLVSKT